MLVSIRFFKIPILILIEITITTRLSFSSILDRIKPNWRMKHKQIVLIINICFNSVFFHSTFDKNSHYNQDTNPAWKNRIETTFINNNKNDNNDNNNDKFHYHLYRFSFFSSKTELKQPRLKTKIWKKLEEDHNWRTPNWRKKQKEILVILVSIVITLVLYILQIY